MVATAAAGGQRLQVLSLPRHVCQLSGQPCARAGDGRWGPQVQSARDPHPQLYPPHWGALGRSLFLSVHR